MSASSRQITAGASEPPPPPPEPVDAGEGEETVGGVAPVGGVVVGGKDGPVGIALTSADGAPAPASLAAETVKKYSVPCVSPVISTLVSVTPVTTGVVASPPAGGPAGAGGRGGGRD